MAQEEEAADWSRQAKTFLSGGGEIGALMRAKDWSSTPLGSAHTWPHSLKTVVRILLTSRYAMWMGWGPDLAFLYNDAYTPTLGEKHPWALGTSAREVWSEIWPDIGPRIDVVLQRGQATWDEGLLLFLQRRGYPEETYHTFSYSPLADDAGAVGGMLCVVTEETERVIGERRLALLNSLGGALASINTQQELFAAMERCLQTNARDLPFTLTYLFDSNDRHCVLASRTGFADGHPVLDALARNDVRWPIAELLATGAPIIISDLAARLPSPPAGPWDKAPTQALLVPIGQQGQGQPAGFSIAAINPYRPLDGPYRGFVSLFVGQVGAALANVRAYETERRRAEALAEIDRAKTAFFSNVSHEFRTPLTLIIAPLQDILLHDAQPLPAELREPVAIAHRNSLRLLKLVNTLLDFSRIEAGRVEAVFEPTHLAPLTAELASVFRSAIERAGMRLIVSCPALDEPVYIDRDMWEKIVLNLVSNAFKYTLEGEIRVSICKADGHARLIVADTGTGIPQDALPHLFERFYRVPHARGRTQEGTGIGLALVNELVKLQGGTIGVTSEVDRGTTITLAIPFGTAHLPEERIHGVRTLASTAVAANAFVEEAMRWLDEPVTAGVAETVLEGTTPRAATEAELAERPTILLADDNADMRNYVRGLLSGRYRVEAVADGAEALEALRRVRPALIISDIMMPNLDGFGLLREVRADPKLASLPVIFLSARAGEEATVEGIAAGADDYLVKPFSARELLARAAAQIERKRFERALHETEERLEVALKNAPLVLYTTDRELRYTWIQRAPMEFDATVLLGRRDDELAFYHNADELIALEQRVLDSARGVREELWLQTDGQRKAYDLTIEPLKSESNEVVGLTVAGVDVTQSRLLVAERERLLEGEREARTEAERINRMKDEFLATLSHELRTPLNAILGWAQILARRGTGGDEDLKQGVDAIQRNARSQSQMIEDLLDMNRIMSGKVRLDVQRVAPAQMIDAAIESLQPALNAKRMTLLKLLDPLAGPVSGDPNRLQQVVWNLISNAVKFTPAGGKIQVMLERVNSHIEITVSDTGQGISPQFLPYVFDRFRQADASTTRRQGGLGLGLSIVKQLVELHGGSVRAKSPGEGQGATFVVALPVTVAHTDSGEDRQHPSAHRDHPVQERDVPSLADRTILVVDDDLDARELIKRILAERGANVLLAASAAEAYEMLRSAHPHLLLSDIGMPEQDGYDLIRKVRALPTDQGGSTPAVALTAFARSEDRRRAFLSGYQMHISKPVEPTELIAVCAAIIGRQPSRQH
jgi:signal transduction histidine kinase/response regulator of citrate/malate metabolism